MARRGIIVTSLAISCALPLATGSRCDAAPTTDAPANAEGSKKTHWSYAPLQKPAIPVVAHSARVRDPIDAFVLAPLEAKHIEPSPEADQRTLLRRVYLDLLGLPPSDDDVEHFVADTAPDAYERVVDRLLASPRYGERMAVAWLDLARYADTVGYHGDQNLHAYPYRDWVIDAFNADLPFDEFTIEQLAGDLLPNPTPSQLVATGFNRLNMVTREGGAQENEYLAKYAADRVRTVSTTFLGSTMGCCECHDHKYDPFTMKDFYSLAAFFADVKQWGVYTTYAYTPNPDLEGFSNDHPFPPEAKVEVPFLQQKIAEAKARIDESTAGAADDGDGFARFCESARAFLTIEPDGFETCKPEILAPEGCSLGADSRVIFPTEAPQKSRLALSPNERRVAAVKIEIVRDAAHHDELFRKNADGEFLRIALQRRAVDEEKPTPVPIRRGEGTPLRPRYSNGDEIRGVTGGWWVFAADAKEKTPTATYLLATPIELLAGESLVVELDGNLAGALRISTSPFATPLFTADPTDPVERASFERLLASVRSSDPVCDPFVRATYARSDPKANAHDAVVALDESIRRLDGGIAPTVITQAREPRITRVLPRGNWQNESGEVVLPATPHFLPGATTKADGNRLTRLDLARWIVAPENPLTARTFANRLWKQFFGVGLSSVVDDLGLQGEVPSHPQLLDWLAVTFREEHWSVKSLVRHIVLSSTYRQSSNTRDDLREVDPQNRWLAAQSPRRLDAEFVRDNALCISGLLNLDRGGPPVKPYQPQKLYEHLQFPDRDYAPDQDDRQWRRGVYMHWQRTFLHPMLANFDAPSREECTASRVVANTPQQALTLLNDPTFVEAARSFAVRLLLAHGKSDADRLALAFHLAFARPPSAAESDSLLAFLAAQRARILADDSGVDALLHVGIAKFPNEVERKELAAWTLLTRVLLNLHECITRY